MKKLLILAFLAAPLYAGSATTTAGQDATLVWAYTQDNKATCAYYGLPASCTMGQARQQFCKRAGVGGVTTCTNPSDPATCTTTALTPTCDGNTQVIIWSDATAYLQRKVNLMIQDDLAAKKAAQAVIDFNAAAASASQATKDKLCVDLGFSAGCF